jgi:hypothetical protein
LRVGQGDQPQQGHEQQGKDAPRPVRPEPRNHPDSPLHLALIFEDAHQSGQSDRSVKSFNQADDRIPVRRIFARCRMGERQSVARQFAIRPHPSETKPHDRIEPMQKLQRRHQPVHRDVAALEMGQFVQKDMAELLRREIAEHRRRQQ